MVIMIVIKIIVLVPIDCKPGINFKPSTADKIVIAGVITPSPNKSEIPMYPKNYTTPIFLPFFNIDVRISFNTIIPPSPLILKLIASQEY